MGSKIEIVADPIPSAPLYTGRSNQAKSDQRPFSQAIFDILGRPPSPDLRPSSPVTRLRPVRHPCTRSYFNSGAERRRTLPNPRGGPKHLYVALNDTNGHALFKLDVADLAGDDSDMDSDVAAGMEEPQPFPQPVLRLSFRSFGECVRFSALGSKIVVTTGSYKRSRKYLTLVYDTKTAKQDIRPFVPDELRGIYDTVAAGNKLYAFSSHKRKLLYLRDALAHPEPDDDDDDMEKSESESDDDELYDCDGVDLNMLRELAEERWTWKRNPTSIPVKGDRFHVTAGAVHPDGRTIFLSTVDDNRPLRSTFSLDMDQPGGEWTILGGWKLPFIRTAHYDRELDAWVGIERKEGTGSHQLCSSDLPATGGNPTPQPAWRLCKEKLTFMQAPLTSMYCTLVHAGRGRFCLVEVAPPLGGSKPRTCLHDDVDQEHLLQVTMFHARYGKNGELTATPLRPGRLYRMSSYDPLTTGQPKAFWM